MNEDFRKYVIVAVPGDEDGQGGIIRQMAYLYDSWPGESDWKLHWLTSWSHKGCKSCRFIKAVFKLIWLRQRGRADVLHVNVASQGSFYRKYILGRIARMMRLPVVVHLHGGGFHHFYDNAPARVQKWIEWLFYHANHCVVLGENWHHFLELRFRMPHEKITLCPNAVPDVAPAAKQNDVPHLLFLGHVLPRKGMDELIEALGALSDVPWKATIAGSGQINQYRDRVAEKGLQARMRFTGWLDAKGVEAQYAASDLLVLPSHVENQPLAVLEAMARGVTVIASRIGTIPELIDHGRTGLLVDVGDVQSLQAAIKVLLEDAGARAKLASAARAEYEKRFTLERYVEQWRTIYQETLSL